MREKFYTVTSRFREHIQIDYYLNGLMLFFSLRHQFSFFTYTTVVLYYDNMSVSFHGVLRVDKEEGGCSFEWKTGKTFRVDFYSRIYVDDRSCCLVVFRKLSSFVDCCILLKMTPGDV